MKRGDRNKVEISTIVGPKRENAANSAETNLICVADGGSPVGNRLAEGNKVETSTIVGPKRENAANSAETNLSCVADG
jgi:cold shock CspA family protein